MELSRGCKLDIGVRQSGDSSRWLRRKDFLVVPVTEEVFGGKSCDDDMAAS